MTSTTVEDLMIRNIFGVFGELAAAARAAAAADPPIARGAAESVAGWRSGAPRSTPVESSAHCEGTDEVTGRGQGVGVVRAEADPPARNILDDGRCLPI